MGFGFMDRGRQERGIDAIPRSSCSIPYARAIEGQMELESGCLPLYFYDPDGPLNEAIVLLSCRNRL